MSISLFHLNSITGEPGKCRARYKCPYGDDGGHFSDPQEARDTYEKFAAALFNKDESAPFFFTSDIEDSDFSEGDCALLTRVLHKKTGWPIFVLTAEPEKPIDSLPWDHMVVQYPDGRFVDVAGLWREEDLVKNWGKHDKISLKRVELDDFSKLQVAKQVFESSPTRTANKILKVIA